MSINHNVDLNLSASVMPPVLNMAQYDANSRTIVATLWDGTSGFNVPSGSVVMVRFGKPDNTGGLYDKTESGEAITYSGNVVTAPVATQMLSVAGKVQADIEIYQTGETAQASVKLATFCFTVNVEKAAYPDAEIISSDYYNIISGDISEFSTAQEQIIASQAALEEVAKSITGNVESAQQAAQTAIEKANAAATSAQNAASSETSANNANAAAQTAKTNAESAKTAAENAKIAAQDAKTAADAAKNDAESAKIAAETANQSAIAAAEEAQNFATAMQECEPYSSTKSYVVANMVTSGGSTYRCIKPCTGISPPNSTYWLLIAKKGADGLGSGDMTKSVYDPQGKEQDIFAYVDAKYSKPSGGIPKTDLASDVQTSLGKADSALQSAPVTSVNSKTGAVNLAKGDVGLGNVDNVKQYSASNPPPYPVTSVNGKTGAVTVSVPTIPSTTSLIKGNGAGGVSAAAKGTDYAAPSVGVTATLTAAGWDANAKTQTVSVAGVTATANCIITAAPDSYMAYAEAGVRCTAQGAGTLTFACETVPTADVAANVLILG